MAGERGNGHEPHRHQLGDRTAVGVGPIEVADDPPAHQDEHAVRQRQHFVELVGHQQHGTAGGAHLPDEAMDVAHSLDVDPPRGIGCDEDLRIRFELAPDHQPLLIAAGQRAGGDRRSFGANPVALDNTIEPLAPGVSHDDPSARELRPALLAGDDVGEDGLAEGQALVPAVGGDVGEAGAAALGRGPVGDVDAGEPDNSVCRREPDDRLDERSLT